jgi:hypothetical protein
LLGHIARRLLAIAPLVLLLALVTFALLQLAPGGPFDAERNFPPEVDLKRQGRLDVHVPLFPPGDPVSRRELFVAMARKVGIDLPPEELPDPPESEEVGGNEMEGILVRALRVYETQPEDAETKGMAEVIREAMADARPSAHVQRLVLMDLLAVKECTDTRFLPPRVRDLPLAEVDRRIAELRLLLGE